MESSIPIRGIGNGIGQRNAAVERQSVLRKGLAALGRVLSENRDMNPSSIRTEQMDRMMRKGISKKNNR